MDEPMTLPALPDQIRQQLQTANTAPPNSALQEAISSVKKSAMGRNDAGFNLARNLRDKGFTFDQARQVMLRYQAAVTDLGDEAYTTNEAIASLQQAYKGVEEPWPIERLAAADPPSLTPDLLPENVRPFAVDLHEGMSVPFDFVALGMLVAAAGALGRRLLIEPNRGDKTWREALNLWGITVAEPGTLKSPTTRAVMAPLWELEHELAEENRENREQYEEQLADWTKAKKDRGRKPERPREVRLVVQDITVEKLADLMADNPQGLISIRDELSGLLNLLARHDRPTDKAFYLEAANGTGSAVVDRITRGTKYVPAVCLSLFGTIQPDPISSYLAQQRDRGPGDDGFIQRFLIVAPAPEPWHGRAKPPSEAAATAYRDAITALHTTPATNLATVPDLHIRTRTGEAVVPSTLGEPPTLHFTPDAEEHFRTWRNWLEPATRDQNELAAIRAFRGKMRGYAPRIAAILHLLGGGQGDVPLAPLKDAIRWLDILEEHARAIYGADSPGRAGAQVLADRIRDGSLKKRTHGRSFTLRDVMRLGWTRLTSRQAVTDAVDLLIDAHWIIEEPTTRKGSRCFHLNPKLN